ncbi:MAG: hypothetical protein JXR61_13365 [Prolixibacteraceae bacterium]|nr:hypothetical protein [Prolixibacteraceae bacterium]
MEKNFKKSEKNFKNEPTLQMLDDYQNNEITLLEKANVMDDDKRIKHIGMLKKANKSVQFHMYLHRTVVFKFNKRLTAPELTCLLEFFKDSEFDYTGERLMEQKATFIEYLDGDALKHYKLEDMESLKNRTKSLSDVEFNVIANFIVEQWNTGANLESLFKEMVEFY